MVARFSRDLGDRRGQLLALVVRGGDTSTEPVRPDHLAGVVDHGVGHHQDVPNAPGGVDDAVSGAERLMVPAHLVEVAATCR